MSDDEELSTRPIKGYPTTNTMISLENLIGQVQALQAEVKRMKEIIENQNLEIKKLREQNQELREENGHNEIEKNRLTSALAKSVSEPGLNVTPGSKTLKADLISDTNNFLANRPSTPFHTPDWEEEERMVEDETLSNQGNYTEFPTLTDGRKNKKRKISNTPSPQKTKSSGKSEQFLKKIDKPPNITVCAPKLEILNAALKDIPHKKTFVAGTNNVKLTLPSGEEYCKVRKNFDESQIKFEWYTYENKQTRSLRVMARGIHPETPIDDIRDDLVSQGFDVEKIDQKYRLNRDKDNKIIYENGKRSYTHLPLFMLSFANDTMAKKAFEIRYICNTKVTIEALKRNNQIPQCKNCQEFNHTNKYCNKLPKCVKCGENHLTSDCKKARNASPKCVNCGGNHPANYRGCEVFVKIQKKRDELNKKSKSINETVKGNPQAQNLSNTKVNQNLTYSQAVKNTMGNQKNQSANKQNVNVNDMFVFMNNMMQKFDALLESNKLITNRLNSIENKTQKNNNNKNNKNGK